MLKASYNPTILLLGTVFKILKTMYTRSYTQMFMETLEIITK